MELSAVLSKTDMARAMLAQRDADLNRALRSFLIMVDGRRSLAQMQPMMDALGLTLNEVKPLVEQGLLHSQLPAPTVRRERAAPSTLAPDAPTTVSATTRAPALTQTPEPVAQASVVEDQRTLAAAKFYALHLVTLMLAGQDDAPRRAVRQANTPQLLVDWLMMCLDLIHDTGGPERAAVFAGKIWAVLPDDARAIATDWPQPDAQAQA